MVVASTSASVADSTSVFFTHVFFFFFLAPFCTCQGVAASAKATYSVLRRPARARTSSGSFGSCQARGAGSAHRSHAVQARPRQGCTPLQVGVPAATRRWRAAQQPTLRVLPLVVAQVPPGPVAQRAGGARWLPRRQIGRRRQHRQQPSGSGRGRAQGTSDGVCAAQRCRLTSPGDGANDGGVYGLLRAMPESKSVRDDLDAAVVSNRHIDIHVGQADITGNTRAGFLADHRSSPSKEGGPGRRARRKLRRQPCDRRVGRGPRQAHVRGATGSGTRSRRSIRTRNKGEVTVSSAEVGKAVKARAACGPACDSSSARDAASGWERCNSSARLSLAREAS